MLVLLNVLNVCLVLFLIMNSIFCLNYRVIFTGSVVVVPDIMALASPGERSECRREASQGKNSMVGQEGVRGLRALGVRDLSYRLAFIANSVQVGSWMVFIHNWYNFTNSNMMSSIL